MSRIKAVIETGVYIPFRYQVGWLMPSSDTTPEKMIRYIEKDHVKVDGIEKDVYVGRDQDGDELFMLQANSVNVEYYGSEE